MKKLLLTVFALSTLLTLNLQGMGNLPNWPDNVLRATLNLALNYNARKDNPDNWPSMQNAYDEIIESILSAKNEGRLEDVSSETIDTLIKKRDELIKLMRK